MLYNSLCDKSTHDRAKALGSVIPKLRPHAFQPITEKITRKSPAASHLEIRSNAVEDVHAQLESQEAGGVGWNRTAHDGHKTFVESQRSLVLHERFEHVPDAVRICSLGSRLQSTLQHILRHSD